MSNPIKVAFGSVPKDGGTFTFYRNQRPFLLSRDVDLRCVTLGKDQADLIEAAYVDDGCVCLAPGIRSLKRQAQIFSAWCDREGIDIVIGINSEGILSAIPHLSPRIRVMSRCANGFDHGYRITLSGRERLMAIIALTPRLRSALIEDYGADPALIELIPNGVDPQPFEAAAQTPRGTEEVLQLGFLGRLEHQQKGVMHLPHIVAQLNAGSVPFHLRIAGKGRHEPELRAALAGDVAAGRVEFLGALGPKQVPEFLGRSDIYLFTSHFEGCPNALLEAMMAGAVPVSWCIEGTTDFLIEAGKTGYLCDMADAVAFAGHISDLSRNRSLLQSMSQATAKAAREKFTSDISAAQYARVFHDVMARTPPPVTPRPWNQFRPDPNFPQTWHRWVPKPVKSIARRILAE